MANAVKKKRAKAAPYPAELTAADVAAVRPVAEWGYHSLLPGAAQETLKRAAEEARSWPWDSFERRKMIEQAVDRTRMEYPECFQPERPEVW